MKRQGPRWIEAYQASHIHNLSKEEKRKLEREKRKEGKRSERRGRKRKKKNK